MARESERIRRVSVRVGAETYSQVAKLAKQQRRSLAGMIMILLEDFVPHVTADPNRILGEDSERSKRMSVRITMEISDQVAKLAKAERRTFAAMLAILLEMAAANATASQSPPTSRKSR